MQEWYRIQSLPFNFQDRSKKLAARATEKYGIDSIAITSLANLTYFFDYNGASFERFCAGLISSDGKTSALVVPALDAQKAEKSACRNVYSWTDSEGFQNALRKAASFLGMVGKKIGVENMITLGQMESFREVLGESQFQSVADEIAEMRLIKEAGEIAGIRESARVLTKGYKFVQQTLKAGITETQAGNDIKDYLSSLRAEVDFCAVQSGSNGSIGHALTSTKKINTQDMIVVDISIRKSGYFADFTRTYVIGKANAKQKEVYEIVKKAQATGVRMAVEGTEAENVDKETRSVIEKAGYGEFFVHRTGHGLGLEVHEPPWIKKGNDQKLREGMVFTIEPGIYLPGKFGVRIEDNVVIGKSGTENLTSMTHELVEL